MKWMHPNPRKRHGMESARFFIYLTVPVVVITICSDPKNMNMLLRGFNFVEYPPESKKLPSGNDIVKMMEERESKPPSSEGGQQGGPPSGEAGHNSGWFARWR